MKFVNNEESLLTKITIVSELSESNIRQVVNFSKFYIISSKKFETLFEITEYLTEKEQKERIIITRCMSETKKQTVVKCFLKNFIQI